MSYFPTIAGVALAAVAMAAAIPASAQDTIKIGVLLIDSGPLASLRETETKAVNLAIEQENAAGGVLGKRLEADFISYPGTPDAAVDSASRAIQKDGALFITGMVTSAVAPALIAKMPALNGIIVEAMARADVLTGARCSKDYFRITETDSMVMRAVSQFVADSGLKKWDTISVDYAAGRDSAARFKALITSQGGSIGKSIFTPIGTADFGTKIAELSNDPGDGLYVTVTGADSINFAKQQAQFGLFKKYKMVLGNSFVIPQTLPAQGESVVGVYETLGFAPSFPGDGTKSFVQAYEAKYPGESPAFTSADQYAAIQMIVEALKKANSTDVAAVRAALSGLKANTALGDIEIRSEDHQAIRPVSINEIVTGPDGKAAFELKSIETGSNIIPPVEPACRM